jgi:hypothetical protein
LITESGSIQALFEQPNSQPTILRKGRHGMNAMRPNQTDATMASCHGNEEHQGQTSNFLYEAATVLAIVLFLISF